MSSAECKSLPDNHTSRAIGFGSEILVDTLGLHWSSSSRDQLDLAVVSTFPGSSVWRD